MVSFFADYWYTGDAPATETSRIPECQKQWILNAIDVVNVRFVAVAGLGLDLIEFILAPQMNWVYPLLFVNFVMACIIQQYSRRAFEAFCGIAYAKGYDRSNPSPVAIRALRRGLYLHIIWHIFGLIAPVSMMYCLLKY